MSQPIPAPGLRLAEVTAALSLAIDLGIAAEPLEFGLRSCLLGLALGKAVGLTNSALGDVYYLSQLRFIGCTTEAEVAAHVFGNELASRAWLAPTDKQPAALLPAVLRHLGTDQPWFLRLQMIARAFVLMPRLMESTVAHCEVGAMLARCLSLSASLQQEFAQVYERWDGKGLPRHLKGDAIAEPVQIVTLAQDAEVWYRIGGVEAARAMARERAGGAFNPALAARFCQDAPSLFRQIEVASVLDAVLAAEPGDPLILAPEHVDEALAAIGDFTDLKASHRAGHSRGVATLAAQAAHQYGLPETDVEALRRAGYLHDVGRVGVTAALWGKTGPLTMGERERIRLYPYYTDRVLAQSAALATVRHLAGRHAERLDGSGYHRGLAAPQLSMSAKILAAADVYQALIELRPYRPAFTTSAAAAELRQEVGAGRLDREAADIVLSAAGHRVRRGRRSWPAGLSEREVSVLRLLARGLANRQMADQLVISEQTVHHHIQHIYDKIGLSTRAAATLFAVQHDLLGPDFPTEK